MDIKEIVMYGQTKWNDKAPVKQGEMSTVPPGPAPRSPMENFEDKGAFANTEDAKKTSKGSEHMSPNFDALAEDRRIYG